MYLTEFKTIEDVLSQYSAPDDALRDANVLLAWYGYGDYCGSSFVLFEKDGKLFEVNAAVIGIARRINCLRRIGNCEWADHSGTSLCSVFRAHANFHFRIQKVSLLTNPR